MKRKRLTWKNSSSGPPRSSWKGLFYFPCKVNVDLSLSTTAPAQEVRKYFIARVVEVSSFYLTIPIVPSKIITVVHLLPIYTISIKVTLYLQVLKNVQFLTWVTCAKLYFSTNRPMCTQKTLEQWTTQLEGFIPHCCLRYCIQMY